MRNPLAFGPPTVVSLDGLSDGVTVGGHGIGLAGLLLRSGLAPVLLAGLHLGLAIGPQGRGALLHQLSRREYVLPSVRSEITSDDRLPFRPDRHDPLVAVVGWVVCR